MKDFKHKNCMVCLVSKSAKKLKYILACLYSSTTEILLIPYQSIYFMDIFNSQHFHTAWLQKVVHTFTTQQLKDTCFFKVCMVF